MIKTKRFRRTTTTVIVVTALVFGINACGNDDASAPADETGRIELSPVTEGEAVGEKPDVVIPDGPPPTDLLIEDLRYGDGPQISQGSFITAHYVGVSWSTGEQFDSSWDRGAPFQITVGVSSVIEGWTIGLQGMSVGGQRRLTIPPELAYGSAGIDGVIAPSETLVFVIDLLAVE
jgi:peptidylprolyl isomerase